MMLQMIRFTHLHWRCINLMQVFWTVCFTKTSCVTSCYTIMLQIRTVATCTSTIKPCGEATYECFNAHSSPWCILWQTANIYDNVFAHLYKVHIFHLSCSELWNLNISHNVWKSVGKEYYICEILIPLINTHTFFHEGSQNELSVLFALNY